MAVHVVYRGEVEVEVRMPSVSQERAIKVLGRHASFGEMSVLDGQPRSATVVATEDSLILKVSLAKFNELLHANDLVAFKRVRHMANTLSLRQRASTGALSKMLHVQDCANVKEGISEIVG